MAAKKKSAKKSDPAVIVRAHSGVFFGYLIAKDGSSVTLRGARQIYYWDSVGLPEKSNTCPDIAARGLGTGSKVSQPAEKAIVEQVGAVFFMADSAAETVKAQKWATR